MNAPNMPLKVAIVDDEPLARMRIRTLLGQSATPNEVVGEFGESVSALMWLQEQDQAGRSPDLVVLDIQMPGLDGMGVLAKLRDAGLNIPVIVQTAHGGIDNVVSAMRAGIMAQTVPGVLPRAKGSSG